MLLNYFEMMAVHKIRNDEGTFIVYKVDAKFAIRNQIFNAVLEVFGS